MTTPPPLHTRSFARGTLCSTVRKDTATRPSLQQLRNGKGRRTDMPKKSPNLSLSLNPQYIHFILYMLFISILILIFKNLIITPAD